MISLKNICQHFINNSNLSKFVKNYSKEFNPLTYIEHQFSKERASKLFVEHDAKRLFAPNVDESKLPMASDTNPLQKVLIPTFCFNTKIGRSKYEGKYGVTHTYTTTNEEGKTETHSHTTWHYISGKIGPFNLTEMDAGMKVYGGLTQPSHIVEEAFEGYKIVGKAISLDVEKIDLDTDIDPFLKKAALAQEIAYKRIRAFLVNKAENDISRKSGYFQTRVNQLDTNYESFETTSHLLAAYILKYDRNPPRILSAIDLQTRIAGPNPVSTIKVTAAVTAITAFVALFLPPQYKLAVRLLSIAASSIATATLTNYKPSLQNSIHNKKIEWEVNRNEAVSESPNDRFRRKLTEKVKPEQELPKANIINVSPVYFHLLGLDPSSPYTEKEIQKAYIREILKTHPDRQNPQVNDGEAYKELTEKAAKINHAKQILMEAYKNGKFKRHYSKLIKQSQQIKEPPESLPHPRAHELITEVLEKKNYVKAFKMVNDEDVSPDCHDEGENTLLTEAAKRGDIKALNFIIDKLSASLDTSCDCPVHRTALHYAAQNGNREVVKLLLEKGANPNLLNSYGETSLDVAIANNRTEVASILTKAGALRNEKKSLFRSVFGYSSKERTLLIEENEKEESVIHLPPSKKK